MNISDCLRRLSGEVVTLEAEEDEYMILKTPQQVAEIAEALPQKTREECRERYYRIDVQDYGFELDEDDFEYTWEYLQGSIEFQSIRRVRKFQDLSLAV